MQESSKIGDAGETLIPGHAGCIDLGLRVEVSGVGHKLNVRTLHTPQARPHDVHSL